MHTDLRNTDIKKFWTRSNLTFFLLPVIDPMSSFSYNIRPVCRLRTFKQFLKRLLFILTYITKVITSSFQVVRLSILYDYYSMWYMLYVCIKAIFTRFEICSPWRTLWPFSFAKFGMSRNGDKGKRGKVNNLLEQISIRKQKILSYSTIS